MLEDEAEASAVASVEVTGDVTPGLPAVDWT